ncbi:mCG1036266, partial [Mus musculus]
QLQYSGQMTTPNRTGSISFQSKMEVYLMFFINLCILLLQMTTVERQSSLQLLTVGQ